MKFTFLVMCAAILVVSIWMTIETTLKARRMRKERERRAQEKALCEHCGFALYAVELNEEGLCEECAEVERVTNEQCREFEQWMESIQDPEPEGPRCELCGGLDIKHHIWQCSGQMEEDCEELDLTGPEDPTDLFATEAMKQKRELRQLWESLNSELPEDHPKRKGW